MWQIVICVAACISVSSCRFFAVWVFQAFETGCFRPWNWVFQALKLGVSGSEIFFIGEVAAMRAY